MDNGKKIIISEDAALQSTFEKCVAEATRVNDIPQPALENYKVKRGLREADGTGVLAGVTNIGNVHGYVLYEGERVADEGKLEYRGFDMAQLVDGFGEKQRFGFEECIYLLLFGKLPTEQELADFTALLAHCRHLPAGFSEDVILKAPSRSIMNKMSQCILALYSYDDDPDNTSVENMLRQSIEIIARLPVIAAQSYRVYSSRFRGKSLNLHDSRDHLSAAQNFLRVLRASKNYTEEEARLLDICMVIQAEHGGGNNSTFACRVLSSSGTDTYSAISAAIGSLKGPLHGGANIKVKEMFDCIKENVKDVNDEDEIKAFVGKILRGEAGDGTGKIYGMGHAIYTNSDPRAVMLKKYAEDLAIKKGFGDDFKLLQGIEKVTPELFYEHKGVHKAMCANVDLYSGLVYRMLDIPPEMYTPLFAVARVAGWCAHRIEEAQTGKRIIRPAYKCIATPKDYVSLEDR
ncbi:MAG: citrate synthase [Clostridia bacterium]|nr:citrate synthase [Clostridia bacterium]